jgi:hypothetical protein
LDVIWPLILNIYFTSQFPLSYLYYKHSKTEKESNHIPSQYYWSEFLKLNEWVPFQLHNSLGLLLFRSYFFLPCVTDSVHRPSSTLKMEATGSSKILVCINRNTWHDIQQASIVDSHQHESFIHSFIYSHSMDPYKVIQNHMDVEIVNRQ